MRLSVLVVVAHLAVFAAAAVAVVVPVRKMMMVVVVLDCLPLQPPLFDTLPAVTVAFEVFAYRDFPDIVLGHRYCMDFAVVYIDAVLRVLH